MSSPDWNFFAFFVGLITLGIIFLTRSLNRQVSRGEFEGSHMTSRQLMLSTAVSQAIVGVVLLGVFWLTDAPVSSLKLSVAPLFLPLGIATGIALSGVEEISGLLFSRFGIGYSTEDLRRLFSPSSPGDWLILVLVLLPVIACFEELLFRGVLIGALSVGFGASPWVLAVISSVVFGVVHSYQGFGGVLVTGVLSLGLSVLYILSGSLAVAVLAHYTIDVIEFVLYEGVGVDGWK